MKFGICGYGNLGKAIEREIIANNQDEIVAIFTRRNHVSSQYQTPVECYSNAPLYAGNIDAMIMCGGSQEDLQWQSPDMLKYFNIIDTFDTHPRIKEHGKTLDKVAKKYNHTAIFSCGWDPGIFSIVRTLLSNVFDSIPYTFWGKGVSQGHSEALRNIPGILDAIQFTVPNEEAKKQVFLFPGSEIDSNFMHERHCYISLDGTRTFEEVENDILNTENYFKGQKVIINQVPLDEIKELKKKMYHEGEVLCSNEGLEGSFHLKMDDNPTMTAKILLAYAPSLKKLSPGAYSILEVPTSLIGRKDNHRFL